MESTSSAEKPKVAEVSEVGAEGPPVIDVSGGVVSTVQDRVAGVGSDVAEGVERADGVGVVAVGQAGESVRVGARRPRDPNRAGIRR